MQFFKTVWSLVTCVCVERLLSAVLPVSPGLVFFLFLEADEVMVCASVGGSVLYETSSCILGAIHFHFFCINSSNCFTLFLMSMFMSVCVQSFACRK